MTYCWSMRIIALLVVALLSLGGIASAHPPADSAVVGGALRPAVTAPFEGQVDVLARDDDGLLRLYRGNGSGGWINPPLQVGHGWNAMTALLGPGDFSGDGNVDVLARDAAGLLWLYPGNGSGGWLPRVQVGHGWNQMTALIGPGDFSGDGNVDVLARDAAGLLWLYRGNGNGGWLPKIQVGHGWNAMTAILGPGDFSGDGNVDVLARDAAGLLWLYRGNGNGRWLPKIQVGHGWNAMTAILGPGDFDARQVQPVDCGVVACVALTFDDGPSAHTERLLDTLTSLDVPATFFVVGSKVVNRPATVRRQEAAGFAVENHTYSHPQLDTLSYSSQLSQVQRADDAMAAAGIARSTLLRPPYGSWDANTRQLGKPLILWSVDPRDWDGRTAGEIRSHVVSYARSGSIVLMHDTVSATVDAMPGIVADLRAKGFTLVTVETLVPWMEPGDVVYSRNQVTDSATLFDPGTQELTPGGGPVVDEAPFVPEG